MAARLAVITQFSSAMELRCSLNSMLRAGVSAVTLQKGCGPSTYGSLLQPGSQACRTLPASRSLVNNSWVPALLPGGNRLFVRGVSRLPSKEQRRHTRPVTQCCASQATGTVVSASKDAAETLQWPTRSRPCGKFDATAVDSDVTVCGWVDRQRSHGGVAFVNMRDFSGIVQVTTDPAAFPSAHEALERVRNEWVLAVHGRVRRRPDAMVNPRMATGEVEVVAHSVEVLNAVKGSLPFPISASEEQEAPREEIRLKYRHLDLRRPQMTHNLRFRHQIIKTLRRYLEDELGFVEVETPILTKSTPEGARDYLVPSRVQQGAWYALPQSPQLFKQLLMVSGFDRYFQVSRCFRDEDLRADRQPEFTQLDMEMSFLPMEGVLELNEKLLSHLFKEVMGVTLPRPFPRITYADAMLRYGSDRPDTRFGLELSDVSKAVAGCGFKVFADAVKEGGAVKALVVPASHGANISNSRLKGKGDILAEAVAGGAKGLAFARVAPDGMSLEAAAAIKDNLSPDQQAAIVAACRAAAGDLLLFGAGALGDVNKALDRLRGYLGRSLGLIPKDTHNLLWVVDFPMFEYNKDEQRLEAVHHPFTAPMAEDMGDLATARACAYDVVYNGIEIGGGSLRIYKREVQEKVFKAIGLTLEEVQCC
eukprot:jgi/Mesvir1/16279/Mv08521-RA.2